MISFWKNPGLRYEGFFENKIYVIFGLSITLQDIFIVGFSCLLFLVLFLFMEKTITGKAMRACAINMKASNIIGINVALMLRISFILSGVLGAVAGIIITPKLGMSYDNGVYWGIKGFTAAVIGGLNSGGAAIFGGLILGLLEALITAYGSDITFGILNSQYKDILICMFLIIILIIKPEGILSKKSERVWI